MVRTGWLGIGKQNSDLIQRNKVQVTRDMTEKDIMKYWGSDVVAGSGYTDDEWRRECESRSYLIKKQNYESSKAKAKQIGGDHYKNMGVEPWDVVDTWSVEQRIGAYRHGVLKYLMRMGTKDENLQEIKKAAHYIEKLIEVLEERDGEL